jgi:thiamine pyrophosphate-dependent acetolactate synthase large subunit-like protein
MPSGRSFFVMGGGSWSTVVRICNDLQKPLVACRHRVFDIRTASITTPAVCRAKRVSSAAEVRKTLSDADLILAVGVRFSEMTGQSRTFDLQDASNAVHAHICGSWSKIYQPTLQ